MKILLVYPHYPDTFWSFRHAMKFIGRKASFPPLGLLTVAAMLPAAWDKKLVDMNVAPLSDDDLEWADYVFISAMTIQQASVMEILSRCRQIGAKTVAGGPLFTSAPDDFPEVDHLVLGEAELTLPPFIEDLQAGTARHIYVNPQRADLCTTPLPLWELIDVGKYAAMNIQYSRGCPFDCEFCDITSLFGRISRTKEATQFLAELESLRVQGWCGSIFVVDDNFIGDRAKLKKTVLPMLITWMEEHDYPFYFYTEASINLADDNQLMDLMVRAGFKEVFIGIETPNEESLTESGKVQNRHRDLLDSVRRIQQAGLQVHGGFIIGFDSDPPSIFDMQIKFIEESGIVTAMVGLLTALRGTRLYQRLNREGRLLGDPTGNNTAIALNFTPNMDSGTLINGYQMVLNTIYSPKYFYRRTLRFFKVYNPLYSGKFHYKHGYMAAFLKSILYLGILGKERYYYWMLLSWTAFNKPKLFPLAITYAVYGFHFRKITEEISEHAS